MDEKSSLDLIHIRNETNRLVMHSEMIRHLAAGRYIYKSDIENGYRIDDAVREAEREFKKHLLNVRNDTALEFAEKYSKHKALLSNIFYKVNKIHEHNKEAVNSSHKTNNDMNGVMLKLDTVLGKIDLDVKNNKLRVIWLGFLSSLAASFVIAAFAGLIYGFYIHVIVK